MKSLGLHGLEGLLRCPGVPAVVPRTALAERRDAVCRLCQMAPAWAGWVAVIHSGYADVRADCATGVVDVVSGVPLDSGRASSIGHEGSYLLVTRPADTARAEALAQSIRDAFGAIRIARGDPMPFDPAHSTSTFGAGITSLSILVHGPTKVGKTRLAATWHDDAKVIILAAEHGLLSLRDRRIRTYEMDSAETLLGAISWLEGAGRSGKLAGWLVSLDSASDIAERILHTAKTTLVKGKLPDPRQAYGETQDVMMDVMRRFRALPCTTLMVAQQDKVEQPDQSIVFAPSLPGAKLAAKAGYQFELVMAMHAKKRGEDVERWLQTNADGRYEAGDRSSVLADREPPDIGAIVAKIMASVPITTPAPLPPANPEPQATAA